MLNGLFFRKAIKPVFGLAATCGVAYSGYNSYTQTRSLWGFTTPDRRLPTLVRAGDHNQVSSVLKDNSFARWATLDGSDHDALFFAVKSDWQDVIKTLLQERPKRVNSKYKYGNSYITPLGIAIRDNNTQLALLLIDLGANVNTSFIYAPETAYMQAFLRDFDPPKPAIAVAEQQGANDIVAKMLEKDSSLAQFLTPKIENVRNINRI